MEGFKDKRKYFQNNQNKAKHWKLEKNYKNILVYEIIMSL